MQNLRVVLSTFFVIHIGIGFAAVWAVAEESPIIYLQQGWSDADRTESYHKSEGAELIPYSWFLSLERADKPGGRLTDDDFIEQLRLLPDPAHPDKLPVGFTRTTSAVDGRDYVGVNCAFCHTGQISYTNPLRYERYKIRIDGGPSMQFNARFMRGLVMAMGATVARPPQSSNPSRYSTKFDRFADNVLPKEGQEVNEENKSRLFRAMATTLKVFAERSRLDPIEWGFGRFDALGNGGNTIFGHTQPGRDLLRIANAPVSIPSIWGAWKHDWLQWNGSIQHSLARSIAEAISIGVPFALDPTANPPIRFPLQIVSDLEGMETRTTSLLPPPWPADVFPPLNKVKMKWGEALYKNKCGHCHAIATPSDPRRIQVRMVGMEEIGTDPLAALNYARRTVSLDGLGKNRMSVAEASQFITTEILRSSGRAVTANEWRAKHEYVARPLTGVWATPPFLHNGSVPNLYQLLSPVSARDKCFYVDNREYDPIRVGFVTRRCDFQSRLDDPASGFELDTARPGNYNTGHEFTGADIPDSECKRIEESKSAENGILGCEIPDEERWAIIEYVKTL